MCTFPDVEGVVDLAYVNLKELEDLPKYLTDKHKIRRARKGKLEKFFQDSLSQKDISLAVTLASPLQGPSRVLGTELSALQ